MLDAPLVVGGGRLRGRSALLPAGRWSYYVVVDDDASALRATVRREIVVPRAAG